MHRTTPELFQGELSDENFPPLLPSDRPTREIWEAEQTNEPCLAQERSATVSEKRWEKARQRLAILRPLLEGQEGVTIENIASSQSVGIATLYRWWRAYRASPSLDTLLPKRDAGKKNWRLSTEVEAIMQEAIENEYLTIQQKTVAQVLRYVRLKCAEKNLTAPSRNTFDRRIEAVPAEIRVQRRKGIKNAQNLYRPNKGSIPGADYPLAIVQIDHTQADIILVDETYRRPVGRPYLTVALDVFSRMVLGLYLSFDPPGANALGLCLVNAISPKQHYLEQIGVEGEWPCSGFMKTIHTDNAAEFKGLMLQRACELHKIERERRVPGIPNLGAHVERHIGTCMEETHTLPGTTFSNVAQRGSYNSEKHACMTLKEYERWLVTYVVQVYHRQMHEGIGEPPYRCYQRGLADLPVELQPRQAQDEKQLRMDFMPGIERTIQPYGVLIGHLHYYADVLRPFINRVDPGSKKKQSFLFKRDPRDISYIYFCDPNTNRYHPIPFRDRSKKGMSEHEYKAVRKRLREEAKSTISEKDIFAAQTRLREQVVAAVTSTRQAKMTKTQNRVVQAGADRATPSDLQGMWSAVNQVNSPEPQPASYESIEPYNELEIG